MNLRICTGYLPAACVAAYAPPAEGAQAVRKVLFDLIVTDSRGVAFPEKCVIEEPLLQRSVEPRLVAGAALLIEGEAVARPYVKSGVQTGFIREIRVGRIEFMRVPKSTETEGAG